MVKYFKLHALLTVATSSRRFAIPIAAVLLTACGGQDSAEAPDGSVPGTPPGSASTTSTALEDTAVANKLPWDIPIMPGARYVSGSTKFSRTTEKRGGEAIATIAVDGTVTDIITYYESILPELGFEITHNRIYDEATGSLHSENADGEQFRVSAMRGGSNARDGESTAALLAIKAKLAEAR